jgi:hypothetical protein
MVGSFAVGHLLTIGEDPYKETLKSDLRAAHKAAVRYHEDNPNGELTLRILEAYGYSNSDGVVLHIVPGDGMWEDSRIVGKHENVIGLYAVDKHGRISKR